MDSEAGSGNARTIGYGSNICDRLLRSAEPERVLEVEQEFDEAKHADPELVDRRIFVNRLLSAKLFLRRLVLMQARASQQSC